MALTEQKVLEDKKQVELVCAVGPEDFEKAVQIIHDANFKAKAYIFVKPIFLSEKEAIDEAIIIVNTLF